jgi:dCMP deaminase
MALAILSAQRSKDPNKQVGACIVDSKNVILGIGYNGFPRGCGDHQLPWAKKSARGRLGTKYPYVVRCAACCHAIARGCVCKRRTHAAAELCGC